MENKPTLTLKTKIDVETRRNIYLDAIDYQIAILQSNGRMHTEGICLTIGEATGKYFDIPLRIQHSNRGLCVTYIGEFFPEVWQIVTNQFPFNSGEDRSERTNVRLLALAMCLTLLDDKDFQNSLKESNDEEEL